MEFIIKQLVQNTEVIAPQTIAEAVLVTDTDKVKTLPEILDNKIEKIITTSDSGLQAIPSGKNIILLHSNNIKPNHELKIQRIIYDNHGHIQESIPVGKITVIVNNNKYIDTYNSEDQECKFGDDFKINDNSEIILKWNNI